MTRGSARVVLALWLASLFAYGCARPDVGDLGDDYQVVQGVLAQEPVLEDGGERLVLVLRRESDPKLLICVTENREGERLLRDLASQLRVGEAPVVLYGQPVVGRWREYHQGIDFHFEAIGYERAETGRYFVTLTVYGARFLDIFRGVSWSGFLGTVARLGRGAL